MVISNRFSYAWKASVWGGSEAHTRSYKLLLKFDLVMDIVWSYLAVGKPFPHLILKMNRC